MSSYVIGVYRARRPADHVATLYGDRCPGEQHRKDDRPVAAPGARKSSSAPRSTTKRATKNRRPTRTTERRKSMTNRAILPAADTPDGRNGRKRRTARPGACSEIRRQLMGWSCSRLLATETGSHAQARLGVRGARYAGGSPVHGGARYTGGFQTLARGSFFEQRKRLEHGAQQRSSVCGPGPRPARQPSARSAGS
jgi:hypothetical protein